MFKKIAYYQREMYQFDEINKRLEVMEARILAMCALLKIGFEPTLYHFTTPEAFFKKEDILKN